MTQQVLPPVPAGYNTINPFIITRNALGAIEFLKTVFGAEEDMASHTVDTDGLLLHAEVTIGNSRVMLADTKPGWPYTPSLLQIYVDDVEATLKRAEALGAKVVTQPTDFFGDLFSRFVDPWDNLWWVYQHNPQSGVSWESAEISEGWDSGETSESWEPTEEMQYIHDTLLETMKKLGR